MAQLLEVKTLPLEVLRNKFYPPHESEHLPAHGRPSFGFWGARNVEFFNYSRKKQNEWFSWNDLAFRLIQESNRDDHYMVVKKRVLDLHEEFEELKNNLSYFSLLTLYFREQILSYLVPAWDSYGLVKRLSEEGS